MPKDKQQVAVRRRGTPPPGLAGSGTVRDLPDTSNIGHNATLLSGVRIVDAGDVDVRLDAAVTRERTTSRARSIIDLGRLLASIVGGYSVSFPLLAAFEKLDPLTVVLLDVHPDYRD